MRDRVRLLLLVEPRQPGLVNADSLGPFGTPCDTRIESPRRLAGRKNSFRRRGLVDGNDAYNEAATLVRARGDYDDDDADDPERGVRHPHNSPPRWQLRTP